MADVPQRAGWYPDPDGAPGERWWNGAGWSDSRRGNASAPVPVVPVAAPVVYSAENPAPQNPGQASSALRSVTSVNAKANPMAMYGFIAGIIGLFFNFIPVASIVAIVFSARGLARANKLRAAGDPTNLRAFAIIGLVLGIGGVAWALLQALIFIVSIASSVDISVA